MKLFLFSLATLLLSCVSGCGTSEQAAADEDDHHLEHFVPHHKPANFAGAVQELKNRAQHLSDHAGHGHDNEGDEFQELVDIINWVPELAADSDLDESDWNKAASAVVSLAAKLSGRKSGDETLDLKELSNSIKPELKTLSTLIPRAGKPELAIHHDHDHDHEHGHDDDLGHDHEHEKHEDKGDQQTP